MRRIVPLSLLWGAVLLGAASGLAGCGGAGGGADGNMATSARGRSLRLKVAWPSPASSRRAPTSRVIPTVTRSIVVEVWANGKAFDSKLIASGGDTVIFDDLPVGAVQVRAAAFASTDGSGTVAAKGTAAATVDEDAPTDVTLTMASEIIRLEPSCGPALTLRVNQTAVVTIAAKNAADAVVPTDPLDIAPFVDDYGITDAVPDVQGRTTIRPQAVGTTTVRFFDAISNVEGDVVVTVTP